MPVPLADVGRRGRLDLTFSLQHDRTVLRQAFCEVPFKITRPLSTPQRLPHLILMHCTAGLFGGDEVDCSIRVERGARVRLTQQSATKIHPSKDRRAIQRNHITVEAGAELQFLLEPIIPFTDSRLRQTTRIDIEPGARLVFWEALMAGRVGSGERWRFRELASETQLRAGGSLLYLERFLLQPNSSDLTVGVMADSNYVGTGLYLGDDAQHFATRLHEALPNAGIDIPSAGLAVVRVVSMSGPEFHRCRQVFEQ